MSTPDQKQYTRITFETFQERAKDPNLSKYEKIGFPDEYRKGKEFDIFCDIKSKLKLDRKNIQILDIGCGCSDLVDYLSENAIENEQKLFLLDSQEMLDLISSPGTKNTEKIAGKFPDCFELFEAQKGKLDVVLAYSILHHLILDSNFFSFIDKSLELLNYGGLFMLGDIQNLTKRNRFFASHTGEEFHKVFSNNDGSPIPAQIAFPNFYEKIDDAMVFAILQRYRGLGFETYLLPQNESLPFSNRREDIVILKN